MIKKVKKALSIIIVMAVFVASLSMATFAASETLTATPTTSAVLVNGTSVSFQAYNIDGNNYFKLRDLGKVLSGTVKQFEIGYDSINKAITITTGKTYTAVGGELTSTGDTSSQQATISTASVYIDGTKVALSAFTIGGYNYFKLRDVGAVINFGVTYNNDTKTIIIDTSKGYPDVDVAPLPPSTANPLVGSWSFNMKTSDGDISEMFSSLIFSDDGSIIQFLGNKVATYTADDDKLYQTTVKDGTKDTYSYEINSANGQTTLFIDANQFGEMVREGEITDTGAGAIIGIWLSKNEIFDGNEGYFNFTKDGNVLIGIILTGTYTVSATGDSFTDNITSDGSLETSTFKIIEVNGVTELIVTDIEGNQTTMYKD